MREYYDELIECYGLGNETATGRKQENGEAEIQKDKSIIENQISGSVEKIEDLNIDEEVMLHNIDNGINLLYRQYIYMFHSKADILIAQRKIDELFRSNPIYRTMFIKLSENKTKKVIIKLNNYMIPIKDISDRPVSDQKQLLKSLAAAEARRWYRPEEGNVIKTTILKLNEASYIFILSICNYPNLEITGIQLIEHLFGLKQMKHKYTSYKQEKSKLLSRGYWNRLLAVKAEPTNIPAAAKEKADETKDSVNDENSLDDNKKNESSESDSQKAEEKPKECLNEKTQETKKELSEESLNDSDQNNSPKHEAVISMLSAEINKLIINYQRMSSSDVRNIFLIAWGLLLGQYYNRKRIILGMQWDSPEMKTVPIVIDCNLSLRSIVSRVNKQLTELPQYDVCSESELSEYLGTQAGAFFTARHHFLDMEDVAQMIGNSRIDDEVLALDYDTYTENWITLNYNMYERELSIQYIYDTKYYNQESIEGLHSTYEKILEKLLRLVTELYIEKMDVADLMKNTDVDRESRETAQKAYYMKKSGIFNGVSMEELLLMSRQCRLKRMLCEDIIISEGSLIENIYIIGEGNVEISKVGTDSYIKSLRVLSEHEIFGIEGLLKVSLADATYTVIDGSATVLEIPKKYMGTYIAKYSGIMKDILEYQTNELKKFHRLWIMN